MSLFQLEFKCHYRAETYVENSFHGFDYSFDYSLNLSLLINSNLLEQLGYYYYNLAKPEVR